MTKFYGTSTGSGCDESLPTITAGGKRGGGHLAQVAAFLIRYNSSGGRPDQPEATCKDPGSARQQTTLQQAAEIPTIVTDQQDMDQATFGIEPVDRAPGRKVNLPELANAERQQFGRMVAGIREIGELAEPGSLLFVKPARTAGALATKLITQVPGNPARGLPTMMRSEPSSALAMAR